jgi:hypothetical protein
MSQGYARDTESIGPSAHGAALAKTWSFQVFFCLVGGQQQASGDDVDRLQPKARHLL